MKQIENKAKEMLHLLLLEMRGNGVDNPVEVLESKGYDPKREIYPGLAYLEKMGSITKIKRGKGRGSKITQIIISTGKKEEKKEIPPEDAEVARPLLNKKVIVLIDYENVNDSAAGTFGLEKVTEAIGELGGILEMVLVFVPVHFSPEVLTKIRRQGGRVIVCPSIKDDGKDTVDKTIEEFAKLLAKTDIEVFLLISEDGHFDDSIRSLKWYRKEVHRLMADLSQERLVSLMDENVIIPLHPTSKADFKNFKLEAVGQLGITNFERAVSAFSKGESLETYQSEIELLRAMVQSLREVTTRRPGKKSFFPLVKLVWKDMVAKKMEGFSYQDCQDAITAIINQTDLIEQRQQAEAPKRYYLLNFDSCLIGKLFPFPANRDKK